MLALLAGCHSRISEELTVVRARDVRIKAERAPQDENDNVLSVSDLWSFVPADMDEGTAPDDVEARASRSALARVARRRSTPTRETHKARSTESRLARSRSSRQAAPRTVRRSSLPPPKRRAATPRRASGKPATKSAARLAREHFLDYPTTIKATRITLYCPPAYAHEATLRGDERPRIAGKRIVTGDAELRCRELTLKARRIALIVREDEPDLQIAARGDVHFVSQVGGQMVRENGIRSLLITNDKMTPLR